jgi:rhodanese-related sulfurtransferase
VEQIGVEELALAVEQGGYVLDVREPMEYTAGHVPGAVPMPLMSIPARLEELPRDRRLHVICAVGGRSAQAVQYLGQNGFDAVNVAGGTDDWIASGHGVDTGA